MVTTLTVALGVASGLEPWRLIVLTAAVLAGQLSVGISNDVIDAARDRAVGRRDKPIARGAVRIGTAWSVAIACVFLAVGLSALLGLGMLAAHVIALASAWAYNLGLKATPYSLLPFLLSFGLFPSFATLAAVHPQAAAGWAWLAGAALGAAVHLSNVLPDFDDDEQTGIRGLPHRLGPRVSAVVASLGVIAGAVAVLLGPARFHIADVPLLAWMFFGVVVLIAALACLVALREAPARTVFRLVMLAALLLAVQLVATGGALAA